jgi:hypothetical protein
LREGADVGVHMKHEDQGFIPNAYGFRIAELIFSWNRKVDRKFVYILFDSIRSHISMNTSNFRKTVRKVINKAK